MTSRGKDVLRMTLISFTLLLSYAQNQIEESKQKEDRKIKTNERGKP